jgi:cytidine deaminase
MKELEFRTIIEEYESAGELSEADRNLLISAEGARDKAYAPYSHFFVGAALELEDGTVVQGNNQENVAYPSGICAERTALFAAGANYPGKAIVRIAISAFSPDFELQHPVYPCGACRQVMSEYERISGQPLQIIMAGKKGKVHKVNGLINLLPVAFDADKLKRNKQSTS